MLVNKSKPDLIRPLFTQPVRNFCLPRLEKDILDDAYDEIELLGFPVSCTWFDMLETSYRGDLTARELTRNKGKSVRMIGHLVCIKYIKTIKKELMSFGCFIDPGGNYFDTTHFPQSLKQYAFKGAGSYLIRGKVVEEFGYPSLEVEKMLKLPVRPDKRY